jgi:hypothetical protein
MRLDGIGWPTGRARDLRAIFGGHFLRAAFDLVQFVADASYFVTVAPCFSDFNPVAITTCT